MGVFSTHSDWNMQVIHTLTEAIPSEVLINKKFSEKILLQLECVFLLNKWNDTIYLTDSGRVDTPTQRETPFDSFF